MLGTTGCRILWAVSRRAVDSGDAIEQRRALRTLVRDMKSGSRDVHWILTEFARGLRGYVHSQEGTGCRGA